MKSTYDLGHYKILSGNQGKLIPIMCKEVLPGERWRHNTKLLIRVSPLLAPVMTPVYATVHHWYVPTRIIWDQFETFITGGPTGSDDTIAPTITVNNGSGYEIGSLADYFGLPTGVDDITHSALPFRAYQTIYNQFYRDEQIQPQAIISKGSGPDTTTPIILQDRAWEKDRFTAARIDPQLGDAVTIPFSGQSEIKRTPGAPGVLGFNAGTNTAVANGNATFDGGFLSDSGGTDVSLDPNGSLYADLGDTTDPTTIRALREAFAFERFWENRNFFGGRYNEYLRFLGVTPSDARLQLPEYLGGGSQSVQFSEVLSTAETEIDTDYTPVGALKGHGIGAVRSNRYEKFFEEHGFVISIVSVKPTTLYYQGIERMWSRPTKFDYWQPELQNVGMDAILNKEVYVGAGQQTPDDPFGWVPRYDEYRHALSSVSGEFRTTLDYWQMGRKFATGPTLGSDFVKADPTDRVYAIGSAGHQLYMMATHDIKSKSPVTRKLSGYVR